MKKKENIENTSEYYQILDNESNHTILKVFTVLIVLCGCLFAIYKFVIVNPVSIFKSGINKSYNNIEKYLDILSRFDKPININGVLSIDSTDNRLNKLDKYKFNLDFNIDNNSNRYNTILGINYNNEDIASLNYMILNNESYLKINNIYDNTIKLDNYKYNNIKVKELKDITRVLKNYLNNQITKEHLSISNDGKDYVELSLTKEELTKLISNIITNIKDNHNLCDTLIDSLNINKEELDNYLDNILKDIITNDFNNFKVRYYYEGVFANIIGMKVLIDDNTILESLNNSFVLSDSLKIEYKDNKYYVDCNNLNIIINQLKEQLIDLDYKYYNNSGIFHYDMNDNHGNIKFSIVNDNSYSFNYDFNKIDSVNIELDEDNIIDKKKIDEDDYLDIYNYIDNNFNNDFIEDLLKDLVQELLNY